ncbi:MAG: NADPH:quinone oxidoreductase family protein [Trueperaceae bacterium]
MRAIVVTEFGGPEVLELREMEPPRPLAGEVLIRPKHISINFADIKARRGGHHTGPHSAGKFPFIPGLDVAGEVEAVGEGVEGLEQGQLVAAATDGGAYAEVVRARQELCFPLGKGTDPRQAAGVVVLMTAYNVLIGKGALQPDETVLVHGAAGAVGTVVLQLARLHGAGQIIAAVGSEEKRETALHYGAHTVVVGRGGDLVGPIREAAPQGLDLILDPVAGEQFESGLGLLAPFGRVVVFGNAGGHGSLSTGPLHSANRSVIGYSSGHYRKDRPDGVRRAAVEMLELLASGEITVPVSRTFPLANAAQAHRYLESRQSIGKLLLEP